MDSNVVLTCILVYMHDPTISAAYRNQRTIWYQQIFKTRGTQLRQFWGIGLLRPVSFLHGRIQQCGPPWCLVREKDEHTRHPGRKLSPTSKMDGRGGVDDILSSRRPPPFLSPFTPFSHNRHISCYGKDTVGPLFLSSPCFLVTISVRPSHFLVAVHPIVTSLQMASFN